jgi:predicted SPOUT superfamily RNA methylase MTH1
MWDRVLQLTKQLLAVQLLPVKGAGPIEQGVVLRVHGLDFIQCGFTTPDPLPEEVKRGQRLLTRLSSLDNYSPMLTEPTSWRTKGFGVTMPLP